jgi:tetratricopeptide (TPR) repeat protein
LEHARLMSGEAKGNVAMQQQIDGILGQRISALLNQAVYLTRQAPSQVTAVDYNTIAYVSATAGNLVLAETNFLKAIETSPDDTSRSGALRSYAQFLFSQRRFEEGRKCFSDAATLVRGGDNMARMQRGFIYAAWSWNERNNANAPRQADDAYEKAQSEFSGIDNEPMRRNALMRLDLAKASPVPPQPTDPRSTTFRTGAPP